MLFILILFEHKLLYSISINPYETKELKTVYYESYERTARHVMVIMRSFCFIYSKIGCEKKNGLIINK